MKHSAIGPCVELTARQDLGRFMEIGWPGVYRLELAIDKAGLRIKINDTIWSAPFGTVSGWPREGIGE